ncbi:MAG: hypothetical protein LBQ43_04915 [Holosporales bacterium]|jgi:hypothetical protein|nr:hypothetical protein [Holosporales bacterium]
MMTNIEMGVFTLVMWLHCSFVLANNPGVTNDSVVEQKAERAGLMHEPVDWRVVGKRQYLWNATSVDEYTPSGQKVTYDDKIQEEIESSLYSNWVDSIVNFKTIKASFLITELWEVINAKVNNEIKSATSPRSVLIALDVDDVLLIDEDKRFARPQSTSSGTVYIDSLASGVLRGWENQGCQVAFVTSAESPIWYMRADQLTKTEMAKEVIVPDGVSRIHTIKCNNGKCAFIDRLYNIVYTVRPYGKEDGKVVFLDEQLTRRDSLAKCGATIVSKKDAVIGAVRAGIFSQPETVILVDDQLYNLAAMSNAPKWDRISELNCRFVPFWFCGQDDAWCQVNSILSYTNSARARAQSSDQLNWEYSSQLDG